LALQGSETGLQYLMLSPNRLRSRRGF